MKSLDEIISAEKILLGNCGRTSRVIFIHCFFIYFIMYVCVRLIVGVGQKCSDLASLWGRSGIIDGRLFIINAYDAPRGMLYNVMQRCVTYTRLSAINRLTGIFHRQRSKSLRFRNANFKPFSYTHRSFPVYSTVVFKQRVSFKRKSF